MLADAGPGLVLADPATADPGPAAPVPVGDDRTTGPRRATAVPT